MANSIKTEIFGNNNDGSMKAFIDIPKQFIEEIRIYADKDVYGLEINGTDYGNAKKEKGSITLEEDEYINYIQVRSGARIHSLNITSSAGKSIGGGSHEGNKTILENIRLLTLSAKAGTTLDELEITYIQDYTPSTLIAEKVEVILDYKTPNTLWTTTESQTTTLLYSYEKVTKKMKEDSYNANVEGEMYLKASASTSIKFTDTTIETIYKEIQEVLQSGLSTTITTGEDEIILIKCICNILQSSDGKYWMNPLASSSPSLIKMSETKNMLGCYDLTGLLYTQVSALKRHKVDKTGYVYYEK